MAAAVIAVACARDTARVKGQFSGHCEGMVYLEQVVPGDQHIVDSARLGRKGDFALHVSVPDGQPTLYNLRYDQGVIPLLLSAGERVTVNSLCDVSVNYTVEGSEESARIRELKMLLTRGGLKLDSLGRIILATTGDEQRATYVEYVNEMNRVKREHLSYIVSRPETLSSLWALYQRLPGEQFLFNNDSDILYYRMVADSTEVRYPASPYVVALRQEVDAANSQLALRDMIAQKLESGGDGFLDITLPDMYGAEHTLSSLAGNVILVDFWHSGQTAGRLNNGELRALYDRVKGRGFEVYQVSLDTQKAPWIAAVQDQKLPWISVSDLRGEASLAARHYNVKTLPTNFLIDRRGQIVGRDLYGRRLVDEVNKLL
jgi:peroxiredoxin